MSNATLLALLADGQFHSGEELAAVLGVSRTAVWKRLKRLSAEAGLSLESVRGKGYRLQQGVDLLDGGRIRAALGGPQSALLAELLVLDSVDSTNSELLRRAQAGAGSGLACTAERQTAGRGRRGRAWVSPYASNIYLSVLWRFGQGAAALEGLSLAVGVAVCRALAACGVAGAALKWPNDVLHGGAKLGGILLEMSGDAAGACQVVVGIGLNVHMPAAAAGAIDQAWTDIRRASGGPVPQRNALAAALLNEVLPLLAGFERQGFGAWRQAWLALDAYAGAPVILDTGGQRLAGVARGVDGRGALCLETASGVQAFHGGEISLRAAP